MEFKNNLIAAMKDNIVVHCGTYWKSKALLEELNKHDVKWVNGDNLLSWDRWHVYGSATCYCLTYPTGLNFDHLAFYLENDYKIIEFEDLLNLENILNDDIHNVKDAPTSNILEVDSNEKIMQRYKKVCNEVRE